MRIVACSAQITAFANEKQFVTVRNEAEASVIALYFCRSSFRIDASLCAGL